MLESLRDYNNPNSLGARMRRKRFAHVEGLVEKILSTQQVCRILDVGGTASYWNLMNHGLLERCEITVSNLERPVGWDPRENLPAVGSFDFHIGNALDLGDIPDKSFDLAHSNSVIEHVGRVSEMRRFASELERVGRLFYVQTPNIWFPIEPHYGFPIVHWLPNVTRASIITTFAIGFLRKKESLLDAYNYIENINLIDRKTLESLFPGALQKRERFLFLTKSLICMGPSTEI